MDIYKIVKGNSFSLFIHLYFSVYCSKFLFVCSEFLSFFIFISIDIFKILFERINDLIGEVEGDIRAILSGERTALNFLQRMSGIATYTRKVVDLLGGSNIKFLDTRKTSPNNRIFEKYAVKVGGGFNHRFNLSDGIMLKDNHIAAAGGIKKAVSLVREYASFVHKIQA